MNDASPLEQAVPNGDMAHVNWGLCEPAENGHGDHRAAAARSESAERCARCRNPGYSGLHYSIELDARVCWSCYEAEARPMRYAAIVEESLGGAENNGVPIGVDLSDAQPARVTTWAPVSLAAALENAQAEPVPALLRRTDGRCLLYPGRTHALHAEPEALKTWLALTACAEPIAVGEPALYIDFEDGPASIAGRLLALGLDPAALAHLTYIRPDEPLDDATTADLEAALALSPVLAVVDGVTEAFSRQGLNPLDNGDVAHWLDVLPRRLVRTGAAVLLLDHVVKDREQRGRYAIGAQHKLAGVDVAYSLRVIEPFARGRDGLVAIKVEKDRPGRVREFAADGQVALLRAQSGDGGAARIKLEPPELQEGSFRPTRLMQRVSERLEQNPGLSKRGVREAVRGRGEMVDLALELLVSGGHVERRREGNADRHYPLQPYREDDDTTDRVPVSGTCPARDSDTGENQRVPVSLPLGDTDAGHDDADAARSGHRVRCCCADGGELDDDGRCTRCWGWSE